MPSRLLLLLVLCPLPALAASRLPAKSVEEALFPVRSVTVFSDQARVTRNGELKLAPGVQRLDFPRLPQSVVPDSVRLSATGAKVTHVEVHPIRLGELPKTEAEKLIERLTQLRDEADLVQDQLDTVREERSFLDSIRPHGDPIVKEGAAPLLLNPAGWAASLAFFDSRDTALSTSEGELTEKFRLKQEEIERVQEQARQLLGASGEGPGFVVSAVVEGREGTAQFSLSYVAMGARWYPTYDVRYTPGRKNVELGFSGLVQQETGENWTDAQLTLSTAVPTTVTALPQLSVWKIGDRERFIPTPRAGPPEGPPPPRPRPPPPLPQPIADNDNVRARLQAAIDQSELAARESPPPPVYKKSVGRGGYPASAPMPQSMAAPAPPPAIADGVSMDMEQPEAEEKTLAMAPRARMSFDSAVTTGEVASSRSGPAPSYVSFASPTGWVPPSFAGDLPAALAGGYDFTYESAQRESIRTGAEARRVPLFSGEYPAESWINILPALSKSAYLVAEVTNSGKEPWLAGRARLFVGADLVGDAAVPTTAPGEKVTLPLGIDDAIRVERNVETVSSERGLFARLDVSAYVVTIELLNTRATGVPIRVKDQSPLARQTDVVVALDKVEPAAFKVDKELKEDGVIEWRQQLAPGAKQVLRFQYEVARPKNWRLWQTSTPGVSR